MLKKCILLGLAALMLAGCGQNAGKQSELLIGLSMADLKEERWQRDRDMFVARAESLGAQVIVQDANGDPNTQIQQCENMLVRGVKLLVVIPKNADAAAPIVEKAHKKQVKVLSYDRVIGNNTTIDVDTAPSPDVSFRQLRVWLE